MLDGRTKYVYRLWTTASETEGKVVINAALFSVDGTTRTETASYTREITHYLNSLNNRYAVVYGAGSVSDKVITLAYTVNPED